MNETPKDVHCALTVNKTQMENKKMLRMCSCSNLTFCMAQINCVNGINSINLLILNFEMDFFCLQMNDLLLTLNLN